MRGLASLLSSLVATNVRARAQLAKQSAGVLALIGLFGGTAYVCLLAALGVWLAGAIGPVGAALVIAVAMATLAIGLLIWLKSIQAKARRRAEEAAAARRMAAFAAVAALGQAKGLLKSGLGLAALLGLAYLLMSGGDGVDEDDDGEA